MNVLITGGAGYIGSHTVVELSTSGFNPSIFDNLSNSNPKVLSRLQGLCGKEISFTHGDVLDTTLLKTTIIEQEVEAVIHFAGLKSVAMSVIEPVSYYKNNVTGTLSLLEAIDGTQVRSIVFSSSATVYGAPETSPIPESAPYRPANPYGHSKAICEQILQDVSAAKKNLNIGILRYFNPVGAHESGTLGEDPKGTPSNLMPYITQVASGRYQHLAIFGDDYPTADGTAIRDYIHVSDLAKGHVAALRYLNGHDESFVINLGTGRPFSVLDVVDAFEKTNGLSIPYQFSPRRNGDVPAYWADSKLAKEKLGWQAQYDLYAMCADSWRWQLNNPDGYDGID